MKWAIGSLFLILGTYSVCAQQLLKGRVVDSKGNPIFGATILELETYSAMTTDSLGKFSLPVNSTDTVRVRCSASGG